MLHSRDTIGPNPKTKLQTKPTQLGPTHKVTLLLRVALLVGCSWVGVVITSSTNIHNCSKGPSYCVKMQHYEINIQMNSNTLICKRPWQSLMSTTRHFSHTMAAISPLYCFDVLCWHNVFTRLKQSPRMCTCYGLWVPTHSSASNIKLV